MGWWDDIFHKRSHMWRFQIFCHIYYAPLIKLEQLTSPIKCVNLDVNVKMIFFFFSFRNFCFFSLVFAFGFFSFLFFSFFSSLCGLNLKCSSSSSLHTSYRHIRLSLNLSLVFSKTNSASIGLWKGNLMGFFVTEHFEGLMWE